MFGNSTGTCIGGTSAFTTTQSNIFSGTSPAITGTGSSIFGSTLSAVTSTESSISVDVSTPVTSAGGVFGITSLITDTGNSIFGFSAGGSSAATSQSPFPNSFTAGSALASGTGNNGVVTSTQTMPVQFGSSATSSSFGLAGNPGFSSSSSPFGSSISAAKPFSSAPSFGLNSTTSLSEANSGSGTTPSVFGSSWQAPKSASLFGSSTSAPFQFSASASSVATNSVPAFGSSTGAPTGSLFPFTSTVAAPSSQPAFGNPSSVNPFGTAPSNNNDQIGMEDSMAEDTIQGSTPTVPAFGQQPIIPSAFGFGMASKNVPHPPGVGISLTPVQLNGTNYLLWSRAIKKYLTAQAKEKYLTDTKPTDNAKEYQKWVEEDAMVTTWLWNSMEPSIAKSTMWVDTTKELWDSLRDRFGLSKNISQIYGTYASFFSCQQGDKSLDEHFRVLEGLWGELNSYHPITTDEKQLQKQREELFVVCFLSGLHPVYESAKNSILTEKELPTMKELCALLKRLSLNEENSSALSPPENIPNTHVPQSEGSSHQSSIGNQSSSVSTALPTATLAQTAAPSSQPAFGNPSSVIPFGTSPSNNNDEIGKEDSMTEDTIQASTPTVPAFGQQPITPAVSGCGFNMAAHPSPFQFSRQQNVANPQNSTLFPSTNSLEFNDAAAGGSIFLGSGDGKSNRRIVKIKSKQRRK